MWRYIRIDIGSPARRPSSGREQAILHRLLRPTGWSSVATAEAIHVQLAEWGIRPDNSICVATGYGRVSVPYADKCVTEITCHGKGACYVHGRDDLAVIDIGGQDTKLIVIQNGIVKDFVMNDKCSAGTGRFLEIMANTLSVRPEELASWPLGAETPPSVYMNGLCGVGGHDPSGARRRENIARPC